MILHLFGCLLFESAEITVLDNINDTELPRLTREMMQTQRTQVRQLKQIQTTLKILIAMIQVRIHRTQSIRIVLSKRKYVMVSTMTAMEYPLQMKSTRMVMDTLHVPMMPRLGWVTQR